MVKTKVSVRKIYKLVKDTESMTNESLKIGLLGRENIILRIKNLLGYDPLNCISDLADTSYVSNCDLVIIAIENMSEADEFAGILSNTQAPFILVVNQSSSIEGKDSKSRFLKTADLESSIFLNNEDLSRRLPQMIIRELKGKRLIAGRLIPSLRGRISFKIINSTSSQNAGIAFAFFLPGADMPVLTLNQIKMVLELAALHGLDLSSSRIKELMATLGSGYLFRNLARQLLTYIPGLGWTAKAGVAYFGTQSLGQLAKKYFEREASLIADKTRD